MNKAQIIPLTQHVSDITFAQGRFDGVDWTQNSNGIVLTSSHTSLIDDPYIAALRIPDAASSSIHVESDADGNAVLDITPRTGLSERRTYDAKTFLLSRIDYDDPRGRRSYVYSAYKRCFGAMTAAHIEYSRVSLRTTIQPTIRLCAIVFA